ncbi:MAG: histidine kinase [Acidobacteriota bacterium]
MEPLYSPHNRAERLIAAGRVTLATSSLFAVWLDPSEPANYAAVAYALLALYVVYAVAIAALVWRSDAPAGRQRLITHAFDFVFFSLFVYFTAGPASPFTTYFVFSMICATLRWQWRGALWTAVASLGTFLALGLYFAEGLRDPAFAPTPFIVRGVYLVVVAVLLGYLGVHEQRTRREMAALAAWPHSAPLALEATLGDLLTHTAQTFEAPRAALAWFEPDEPWLYLATWHDGRLTLDREAPTSFEPLVPEPLAQASFLCSDVAADAPVALARTAEGFKRCRERPLHPDLADRLHARSVLSLRLRGETFEGRLFVLDKAAMTSDDLLLGEVVGERVGARLDLFYLTQRLRETAATEERIRLARDLHDGVLQSLTGIGLRLEALRRQIAVRGSDLPGEEGGLADLQRLVALEQRDLRFFIRELTPEETSDDDAGFDLATRLADLRQRLQIEWGVDAELHAEGLDRPLPAVLAREIYHLVREALVNALRHGQASSVRLEIDAGAGRSVALSVADNGRGFPFAGRFSGPELAAQNLGPRSLRERVAALHGTLLLVSNDAGSRLDIRLPIAEAA